MRYSFVLATALCGVTVATASCNGKGHGGGGQGTGHHGAGGSGGHSSGSGAGTVSSSSGDDPILSGSSGSSASSASSGAAGSGGPAAGSSGSGGSGASGAGSGGGAPGGGLFEAQNPWNTPVDGHPKSPSSDAITGWLSQHGGWGTGVMKIDFSLEVLIAGANVPFKSFTKTGDFFSPDCDDVPFPVPVGGAIEGEQGYQCTSDGDCHLIVVHEPSKKLYEMWRADISGGVFHGGCVAVWDLTKSYPEDLRGEGCTSADAGGFPIASMLFNADEVAAGEIPHAIRFILPNSRIRDNVYVHPGTHTTSATSGGPDAPPYGVRFRLRSDFPLASLPSDGARVVAKALQKYGMFLADGGNIALTATSDRFTQNKWGDVGVGASSLTAIKPTDMEVVDMGNPISGNGDCNRNP